MVPQSRHGPAQGQGKLFGTAAGVVVDLQRRMPAEQGDRALVWAESLLDMKRFPRAFFLIFADTKRVLSGVPHSGFGDLVRLGTAYVDNHETQRPANRRISAKPMSKGIVSTVDTDLLTDRAVDDRHGRSREGGDIDAVNAELFFAHGLNASQEHGKVRRVAASHHCVDSDCLDRGTAVIGADGADQLLWVAVGHR